MHEIRTRRLHDLLGSMIAVPDQKIQVAYELLTTTLIKSHVQIFTRLGRLVRL